MTDMLELNERLTDAAAAAPDQLGVTIGELRRRGTRRRQTRIGLTSAAAVLAVAGGAFAVTGGGGGAAPVAGPGSPTPFQALPSLRWSAPTPLPSAPIVYLSLAPGEAIELGEPLGDSMMALWFAETDSRFALVFGSRDGSGATRLHAVGSDPGVAPPGPGNVGFHAGYEVSAGGSRFLLGYVVGTAASGAGAVATVTLTVDGTPVQARTEAWPRDERVHVWWVRLPGDGGPAKVSGLTASDAQGTVVARVPLGLR